MANLSLKIITKNIFKLLDYSGLTDIMFANVLGISEKQLRLVKSNEAEFNIDNINKAAEFFAVSINKINSEEIEIDVCFREKLALKHKNNIEYYSLLETRPTLRHAIRFTLLENSNFKSNGFTIGEIRDLFLEQKWNFTSGYISTGMARNNDLIEIASKKIIKGKEVNVYKPRKTI
ncbi:hypothetical protein [Pedobacter sp. MR22-3]|uniref:hypothetical protein n=1 Tax=Pedobacter sp. MR22-3 TaxID=2994552 RepID=UPI00224653FB|nr:hypothetical protein [Pedobacter sp. MR22-3]